MFEAASDRDAAHQCTCDESVMHPRRINKVAAQFLKNIFWVVAAWQAQMPVKTLPIKTRAGVLFAIRRHMFVPGDVGDGPLLDQCAAQRAQRLVLRVFKAFTLKAFELNANGVVVAVVAPSVV